MNNSSRDTVEGWRWDFITPWGWLPSTGILTEYGHSQAAEPQGWYNQERAVCLRRNHHAPHPECACGLHGIEHLSEGVAIRLEELSEQRTAFIENGDVPDEDTLIIALSRATFEDVLPTAWPEDGEALAAHPDAFVDPPHTIRGHRKTYREVFLDREWLTQPGVWPAAALPEDGVHYVPDLALWVRESIQESNTNPGSEHEK